MYLCEITPQGDVTPLTLEEDTVQMEEEGDHEKPSKIRRLHDENEHLRTTIASLQESVVYLQTKLNMLANGNVDQVCFLLFPISLLLLLICELIFTDRPHDGY